MQVSILFQALLVFFLAAPIFEGTVTVLLLRALINGGKNPALKERLLGSISLFFSAVLLSILAMNRLFELHVNNDIALVFFMIAMVLIGVPGFIWLYMYFTGKFHV